MNSKKKILLIAYTYPPAPGVGARRWAKLTKYLAQAGHEIHVITADFDKKSGSSPWESDIDHSQIHIHRVAGGLNPNFIIGNKSWRIFRLKERLLYKFYRRFCGWLDYAEGWGPAMLAAARELIRREQILNVVVTGPPNSVNYFGSFLKLDCPQLFLVQDMRDPWNEDPYDYGFPHSMRTVDQKNKALLCQETTFRFCDVIVSVTKDLTDLFIKNWGVADKIVTLTNGFDPADRVTGSKTSEKLKFVYAGFASGMGRQAAMELLRTAVGELSRSDSFWLEQAEFVFIGDGRLTFNEKNFRTLPFLGGKELACEVASSHVGFTINSPEYYYAYGSKIFDYLLQQISIFMISPQGEVIDLINSKGFGYAVDYDLSAIKKTLEIIKSDFLAGKLKAATDVTSAPYSFEALASEYAKLF